MAEPYKSGVEPAPEAWPGYLENLKNRFPDIPWMEPIPISHPGFVFKGLGCRICIAWFGIEGEKVKELPVFPEGHLKHLRDYHHLEKL